ncbi:hypothetical protein MNBD_GAMMA11-2544 [hydrothermal vent metagenome]|uniref:Inner membrane protein YbaN n=1 Tax=hydrothermal vent metagenome TaxID=652676 RepID=A0A3B0WZQ2_9ZZZZ
MRVMYFSLAWVFFALGAIGVLLPVLPTTPFMLLALWAFSRSSERFHQWLYHHRFFGPPLQKWQKYGVIPLPAKIMSVSFMSVSFSYMLMFSPVAIWLKLLVGAVMLYGAWFVLSRPSLPPKQQVASETDNTVKF